jgi:SAM-dependent methyltransferase
MRVFVHHEISIPQRVHELTRSLDHSLKPRLVKKYFGGIEDAYWVAGAALLGQLPPVLHLGGSLRGKRILDLGCGNTIEIDAEGRMFEPWLCRALYELFARPIGVDIGVIHEEFEHYQVDLRKPDSLGFLPSCSIDLAIAHMLFSSPHLNREPGAGEALKARLIPQLERIVKPEGCLVYSEYVPASQKHSFI